MTPPYRFAAARPEDIDRLVPLRLEVMRETFLRARGRFDEALQSYDKALAEKLLAGAIPDGSTVKIDEGDGALAIAVE